MIPFARRPQQTPHAPPPRQPEPVPPMPHDDRAHLLHALALLCAGARVPAPDHDRCGMPIGDRRCIRPGTHPDGCIAAPRNYRPREVGEE